MVADTNDDETETVPEVEPSLLRDIQADLEESLLGGPRRYTRLEIAEFAGVSVERADRLWVSMGYAVDTDPHGVMFTEETSKPCAPSRLSSIEGSSRRTAKWRLPVRSANRCPGWPSGRCR